MALSDWNGDPSAEGLVLERGKHPNTHNGLAHPQHTVLLADELRKNSQQMRAKIVQPSNSSPLTALLRLPHQLTLDMPYKTPEGILQRAHQASPNEHVRNPATCPTHVVLQIEQERFSPQPLMLDQLCVVLSALSARAVVYLLSVCSVA
jgi:hypothetical protein